MMNIYGDTSQSVKYSDQNVNYTADFWFVTNISALEFIYRVIIVGIMEV
jgi:hypothetical protein